MELIKHNENEKVIISASGRIDTNTAPAFEAEIKECIAECSELVLDFAGVEYISSAGLRVLLTTHKTMFKKGGSLKIINVAGEIMDIFDITGFSTVLNIE